MFERFTDEARHVLVLAQEEARRCHHKHIGTEHLLLGLLGEADAVAAKALESTGVTLEAARAKIEQSIPPVKSFSWRGSPPFTPEAKRVLELSLREGLQLGHNSIGTEHLLLGLIRDDCTGARVLTNLGADLPSLREQVTKLLNEPHRQPTRASGWKGDSRDTIGGAVPFVRLLAGTNDVSALVSGLVAYAIEFSFDVVCFTRLDPPLDEIEGFVFGSRKERKGALRFGLRLSDGTRVPTLRFDDAENDPNPRFLLRSTGGSVGDHKMSMGFICGPLPPPGPLAFVCEWPRYGIPETETEIDAELILVAARQAKPIPD